MLNIFQLTELNLNKQLQMINQHFKKNLNSHKKFINSHHLIINVISHHGQEEEDNQSIEKIIMFKISISQIQIQLT